MSKTPKTVRLLGMIVATLLTVSCASTPKAPQNWDGLERIASKRFTAVYARPGIEFASYQNVLLDPVEVAFDKQWDPQSAREDLAQRFTPEALEAIDAEIAKEFRRLFAAELRKGGYELVNTAGSNTLRISPSLIDIYINAPVDISAGRPGTYMVEAGRMTLMMELRDGPTGQLLGRVVDQKAGAATGYLEVSDSVAKSPGFRSAVTAWATQLRLGLDEVNGRP
jgi:hypothetical protein